MIPWLLSRTGQSTKRAGGDLQGHDTVGCRPLCRQWTHHGCVCIFLASLLPCPLLSGPSLCFILSPSILSSAYVLSAYHVPGTVPGPAGAQAISVLVSWGLLKRRAQTNRQPITRPRDHCWGQGQAEGYGDHWRGPSPRLGDSRRAPEEVYALTDGKEVFTKGRREGRKLFQAVGKAAAKA